jgi:hypothetical protein
LPCNSTTSLSFGIAGKDFLLPPASFISGIPSPKDEGFCFARFSTQESPVWTLGSPFTSELSSFALFTRANSSVKARFTSRWTMLWNLYPLPNCKRAWILASCTYVSLYIL